MPITTTITTRNRPLITWRHHHRQHHTTAHISVSVSVQRTTPRRERGGRADIIRLTLSGGGAAVELGTAATLLVAILLPDAGREEAWSLLLLV